MFTIFYTCHRMMH